MKIKLPSSSPSVVVVAAEAAVTETAAHSLVALVVVVFVSFVSVWPSCKGSQLPIAGRQLLPGTRGKGSGGQNSAQKGDDLRHLIN